MKTGVFQIALRLLACVLILFPHYALAGAANIPGLYGGKIVIPPPAPAQPAAFKSSTQFNIPGFYGNKALPSVGAKDIPDVNKINSNPDATGIDRIDSDSVNGQVTVYQNQSNAVINWKSFNIGSDASVYFNQQGNASWVALNRIWDQNPSQIFGRLTADGRIYLINQNGILFGPGSRVNVNSLTASALNIHDDDFLNNVLHFELENYIAPGAAPDPLAMVSNHGELTAANGGYIFLMAPSVENYGLIDAPAGQVGLVAATDVTLVPPGADDYSRSGYYVIVNQRGLNDYQNPPCSGSDCLFGNAANYAGGELRADGGMAGMYGNNVDQWGIVRSVTAFQNKKGQVELRAVNKVTTHEDSVILLPVYATPDPETGKIPTVNDTFDIQSRVDIAGLQYETGSIPSSENTPVKTIELRGSIEAPAGSVNLHAADRVYLEEGSRIDISGVVVDLPLPVIEDVKLTSVELRDAYGQKDGILHGQKITTLATTGSTIGDLSQVYLTRERTALERSIGGAMRKDAASGTYSAQNGSIEIRVKDGDIIVKDGATLDFSGGVINYTGENVNTTRLLSGSMIYDISNAPLYIRYDKIVESYTKTYARFGVTETYANNYHGAASPVKTYVSNYQQGGDAGKLSLQASTIVLDGQLNGSVTRGLYQNTWTSGNTSEAMALSKARGLEAPRAGTLEIGLSLDDQDFSKYTTSISILSETTNKELNVDSPRQTGSTGETVLSAQKLNDAKLSKLKLYALQTISTAPDARINLQPGGAFSATARRIDHQGGITVPGGTIDMNIVQNITSKTDLQGNSQGTYVPLDERIILGTSSSLDVAGERIDNSLAANSIYTTYLNFGQFGGGTISLMDKTDLGAGVFIQQGAVVDVSGGYLVDRKGKVTGGNAGALSIQGSNIMLDGDLRGYALADTNGKIQGGSIALTSKEIHVVPESEIVYEDGKLYLAGNRLDDTGFTQITLNSVNDIIVDTTIGPSLVRLNNPLLSRKILTHQQQEVYGNTLPDRPELMRLYEPMAYMAGPSGFTANAGQLFVGNSPNLRGNLNGDPHLNDNARITIAENAKVQTAPATSSDKTKISLTAPEIKMYGTLESLGGTISIEATGKGTQKNLIIENGAEILAQGYNRPDPSSTPKGFSLNYLPIDGGRVILTADRGDLELADGAGIDISGSRVVENRMWSADGTMFTFHEAGNPGSLALNFFGDLTWRDNAVVNAKANMDGLQGGTLAVKKTDADPSKSPLVIEAGDFSRYNKSSGFDDITLASRGSLQFNGSIDAQTGSVGRKLTLDAPEIKSSGADADQVNLKAPWVVLTNSYFPAGGTASLGNGHLTVSGQWIDVIGTTRFSGFKDVNLKAERDIRLSQVLYQVKGKDNGDMSSGTLPPGMLAAAVDMTLDADRIYPGDFYWITTDVDSNGNLKAPVFTRYPNAYSDYTIQAGGKITIEHSSDSHVDGPIYSAGGNLRVEGLGEGIEVKEGGYLAAPLGTITLYSPHRIYLADGGVLTTAGNTAVEYNVINNNNIWVTMDKQHPDPDGAVAVVSPFNEDNRPEKSITIDGAETIIGTGSIIDVGGGGAFVAHKFLPGIEGSYDPLALDSAGRSALNKGNRYVVFKDTTFSMPGQAVYLSGDGGLSEGMYTMLPLDANNTQNARYAYLPGAYIIETQAITALPGQWSLSKDGYPLIVGYDAVADTSIRGTRPKVYSVRTAADVLTEGHYETGTLVAGNAGNISIKGDTTIINGTLKAAALPGYLGGKISLSGMNIIVQSGAASQLPSDFGFTTSFDAPELQALKNKLIVSTDGLSGQGFREVDLGDVDETGASVTNSITVKGGAELGADTISLAARKTTDAAGMPKDPSITLEAGAKLTATSGEGVITLATPGTLLVDTNATVHATNNITLDVNNVDDIRGDLKVDNSSITLKSAKIFFGARGTSPDNGLYVTTDVWKRFSGYKDITFASRSDIQFKDSSTNLSVDRSLTLDAARILGMNADGTSVTLAASTVNIKNSEAVSNTQALSNAGTFAVNATDQIIIGGGDVLFGGFSTVDLSSTNDLTLKGKGSLATSNANLNITAARVVTASDRDATKKYIAPNFVVDAGTGAINMKGSGAVPATSTVPGGLLEMKGRSIELATVLQSDGGTIKLTSSGSSADGNGIFLHNGARILAKGTDDAPGGKVLLATDYVDASGTVQSGKIELDEGSMIDVSAGKQGDAGLITLKAPVGGVKIDGTLLGIARGGKGGSLILDTYQFSGNDKSRINTDMAKLIRTLGILASGGFTEAVDIRARTGNIDIDQTLTARHVKLTADDHSAGNGQINVKGNGAIDASGDTNHADGGTVELYAYNDLNIDGKIDALGSNGGNGGDVLLSSANGLVNVNANGAVDVSEGTGGAGGTVYLRAQQNGNDVKIKLAQGSISGARAVYAEAVKTYTYTSTLNVDSTIYGGWLNDASTFYTDNSTAIMNRLNPANSTSLHLLPGIEVVSSGDINWNTAWDQASSTKTRFGTEPGILTLRAANNLNIKQNLVDHPTAMSSLATSDSSVRDSWGFNLVAGADKDSADFLAVKRGAGNLNLLTDPTKPSGSGTLVYSESAPIRFASGNDTVIGQQTALGYMIDSTMGYNLASYDGSIHGNVGRDLIITGGAIQTATGDINITVGRDLQLNTASVSINKISLSTLGSIRTTGHAPTGAPPAGDPTPTTGTPSKDYWRYSEGGDIILDVAGNIGTYSSSQWLPASSDNAWDYYTQLKGLGSDPRVSGDKYGQFSAVFGRLKQPFTNQQSDTTAGIVTMGGGDIVVLAGSDFKAQAGTFNDGDLSIYANGDISGRFLNHGSADKPGQGEIHAMGNFGSSADPQQIELFNSGMAVAAMGDIWIGAIVNPSLASNQLNQLGSSPTYFRNCTYTPDTSISLKAGGDVTITGKAPKYLSTDAKVLASAKVLPATVDIEAGGNINLKSDYLTLTSSPRGSLRLSAGGDIVENVVVGTKDLQPGIMMSDIATEYWYGLFRVYNNPAVSAWLNNWNNGSNNHGYYDAARQATASPLHENDYTSVEVHAGGDIKNLGLYVPKKADVTAGGNILDMAYEGQNIHAEDITRIMAEGNIQMLYAKSTTKTGLIQGGPGVFLVQAGGSIDLGSSNNYIENGNTRYGGVQTIGNGNNALLGTGKSTLVVVSGYKQDMTQGMTSVDGIESFFNTLRDAGDNYAKLMADGKLNEAAELLNKTRENTITAYLGDPSGEGDINMVASQIGTSIGQSDIYVIGNGTVNLGKTALPVPGAATTASTGIWTGGGGNINLFTRYGDVNVNESKIMTFYSGDITIWSDQGNINAGRGSRTAVSASPPRKQITNGVTTWVYTPPAIGSGIRAVTYGDNAPLPGNIHLFAPNGVIDAGEAEIAGGRIILAALKINNAANINFSAGSIGVPQSSTGTANIGTMSGSGIAAQGSQLTSDASGLSAARAQASQLVEDIMTKWLDVKVFDFVLDGSDDNNKEEN